MRLKIPEDSPLSRRDASVYAAAQQSKSQITRIGTDKIFPCGPCVPWSKNPSGGPRNT